jgi:hypothetical protein
MAAGAFLACRNNGESFVSRALNIYVVFDDIGTLVGCFTVKYEMVSWLDENRHEPGFNGWSAIRCRNNPGVGPYKRAPVELSIKLLLDQGR